MHPATIFLGQRRRGDGLARAEEGSGEESARASAFWFSAGRALRKKMHNIQISAKPRYIFCYCAWPTHPFAHNFAPKKNKWKNHAKNAKIALWKNRQSIPFVKLNCQKLNNPLSIFRYTNKKKIYRRELLLVLSVVLCCNDEKKHVFSKQKFLTC